MTLDVALFIRCTPGNNKLDVWVDWGINVEQTTEVLLQFDDEDQREIWDISTDGDALFAPDPNAVLRRLLRADFFFVGTINERSLAAAFNVVGLRQALASLSGWTCGVP